MPKHPTPVYSTRANETISDVPHKRVSPYLGQSHTFGAMRSARRLVSILALLTVFLFASCASHRHTVGIGAGGHGQQSMRQYYFFWGLISINDADSQRMTVGLSSYIVDTRFSLIDLLLSPLLVPFLMTSRTVTVYK